MVDFPEYYEQMRSSLTAPAATPIPTEVAEVPLPLPPPPAPPVPTSTPRRPATVSPETVEDLEQFQRDYLARLRAGPPQQPQLSTLDMLRKRMARNMETEELDRAAEFGAGMLATGGPNFFRMLAGGARAAREGDVSRTDRLRQLAETERQQQELENRQAAARAEEAYRQESLRLRRLEAERAGRPQFQVVGTDEKGNAVVMDPRNPTQRIVLEGVTPTQVANLNARTDAAREAAAVRAGTAAVAAAQRDALGREIDRGTLDRIFREAYDRAMNSPQTGGAPQTSAAPSQTLKYSGPRISSQPQQ